MAERFSLILHRPIVRALRPYHTDSRSNLTSDTLDSEPHVDKQEVTLADVRSKWFESTMGKVRDDDHGHVLDADLGQRGEVDFVAKFNGWSYRTVHRTHSAGVDDYRLDVAGWLSAKEIRNELGHGAGWWCRRRRCRV